MVDVCFLNLKGWVGSLVDFVVIRLLNLVVGVRFFNLVFLDW